MSLIAKATLLLLMAQVALCQGPGPKLDAILKDCQKSGGVTDVELATLYDNKSANNNPSEKAKCHVKCTLEKMGFFKNNAFDGDNALKILVNVPNFKGKEAELNQAVKDCKDIKGSNACDTAFLATKCFKEHPQIELFPLM